MGRQLIAIVVGLAGGGLAIMLIEALSSLCYPPPEGLTRDDKQALIQFIQGLPVGAFLFVLAAHSGGSGLRGLLSPLILRRRGYTSAAIVGVLFLIGGILNALSIPHPVWFTVVDLLLYLPLALLGCRLAPVGTEPLSIPAAE